MSSSSGTSKYSLPLRRVYDNVVDLQMSFNSTGISIMKDYYNDYFFISLHRLELMSPEELQRRSIQAQRYWVRY